MIAKAKPKVGQRLYRLNVGNNARHCTQKLTPVVVSKVGRKYFTVKQEGPYAIESEHHLESWHEKTEYSANYACYESEQSWADEKEATEICKRITEHFQYGRNRANLPIDALRTIMGIVEGGKP